MFKDIQTLISLLVPVTSLSLLVSTDTVATYLDTVLISVLAVTVNTESAITQSGFLNIHSSDSHVWISTARLDRVSYFIGSSKDPYTLLLLLRYIATAAMR